jgi:hypothetical protein
MSEPTEFTKRNTGKNEFRCRNIKIRRFHSFGAQQHRRNVKVSLLLLACNACHFQLTVSRCNEYAVVPSRFCRC